MADAGHNRILVYSPSGSLLAQWGADGGNGAAGSGPGAFIHPEAVAVSPEENVYVADTNNNRVVELSPERQRARAVGLAWRARRRFHQPTGIAVDGAGRVYVVDRENNRVEVFGPSGEFLFKWGIRGVYPGDFSQPSAIAVDCDGDVYVADTNNNRVQRFDLVSPAASGCLRRPACWPPPLDVAPGAEGQPVRGRSGTLARARAGAAGQLPARLQDPRRPRPFHRAGGVATCR